MKLRYQLFITEKGFQIVCKDFKFLIVKTQDLLRGFFSVALQYSILLPAAVRTYQVQVLRRPAPFQPCCF